MKLALLMAVLATTVGCNAENSCGDRTDETDGLTACLAAGNAQGYCSCFVNRILETHSCHAIETGNVSLKAITEACQACGGTGC